MSRRNRRSTSTLESDDHFIRMMEWLAMESKAEIERMERRRMRRDAKNAEKSGETLIDLAVADHRPALGGRHVLVFVKRNRDLNLPWNRLRVGSPVVLSEYPENGEGSVTGVVSGRKVDSIRVTFDRIPDNTHSGAFRIDLTADEVTRQRQLAAITIAKDSRGRLGELRQILMGEREPDFNPKFFDKEIRFRDELNPSQQEAVRMALAADDLAIIHGPPGTGKTTTAIELIIQSVDLGQKVLACAPSNTAVDNLLEKLVAAGQKVVRIGHPARVMQSLQGYTIDGLVEKSEAMPVIKSMLREAEEIYRRIDRYTRAKPQRGAKYEMRREAQRLKSDARLLEQNTIKHLLDRADIVCATTTFNEGILEDRWFDVTVIDEACQSTEPGCWVAIGRADKIVLAGDHHQLPPTVLSDQAAREGFKMSLLERANNIWGEKTTRLLETQYRMHDQIMQFSSDFFYDGRLIGDPNVQQHLLSDLPSVDENELTKTPVTFIDSAGASWDEELEPDGESKRNPNEAKLILAKVEALLNSGLDPEQIAVIAPYAAQVRLLRENSADSRVEIDTVDGFQGREKEAVLITMVRSNASGEIGFLGDERRMNVALTRAKRKLIVVGDSATLGGHPFYKQLLDYFESIDSYHSVWTEMQDDDWTN